ncbi:MAG: aldo/keto reductase, partial [Flavobacteriaceae bacterium]|nr:aldo/keto reductase [Flavobacteriaceae bacterium]
MKITDVKGFSVLSNGVKMPYLGLGVYKVQNGTEVIDSVHYAIETGYRHIDTASYYYNEEGVGKAVQTAGLPREEIFVTTKLWHTEQRYEAVFKAFETSMNKLQLDYLDLYLIHWPHPQYFLEAWQAMEELYKAKKIRAIGVCNCTERHIRKIMDLGGEIPTVNQVEFHPNLVQQDLLNFCQQHDIQLEAWSPLKRGELLDDPVLIELSKKYGKNT